MTRVHLKPSGPEPSVTPDAPPEASGSIPSAIDSILRQPVIFWLVLAFLLVFLMTFIRFTFINEPEIRLYSLFPSSAPIGNDLRVYLNFSTAILTHANPYFATESTYPPFQAVFFLPFTLFPIETAYNLLTVLNYICFIGLTFLIPLLFSRERKITPTLILILAAGLFSYGFLFQLERGQYDLIVALFLFGSVYLFHYHPRQRWLAYLLFVISVQMKIYPLIFVITFVSDWSDWKGNIRRWVLLLLANFGALFILGPTPFLDFVNHVASELKNPTFNWSGNHSTHSFIGELLKELKPVAPGLKPYAKAIEYTLFGVFGLFLGLIWYQSYRRRLSAANPYLLLACSVGMLVIPSTSHDYKLAIFMGPMAILLNALDLRISGTRLATRRQQIYQAALVFLIALAFCFTFFLHLDKTILLRSNYIPLMVILIAAALLMILRARLLDQSRHPESFPDLP